MIWPAPRQSDWSHFWPPCTHWQRDLLESRSSQALESPLCWDFHCCFWHGYPFLGLHPPHLFNWPKAYFWPKLLGVPLQPLRTSGKHFFGLVNNAYFPPVHSSKIYAKARILTFPCKDPRSFYCPWPAYNCSYFFHFAAISTKKRGVQILVADALPKIQHTVHERTNELINQQGKAVIANMH